MLSYCVIVCLLRWQACAAAVPSLRESKDALALELDVKQQDVKENQHSRKLLRDSSLAQVEACNSALAADSSYPRHYVVHHVTSPPNIDGRLDEEQWKAVPWTDAFVDIAAGLTPRKHTQAKLLWDKDNLYVGAWLQEDQVWANITEHDSVIFHDNDFEVFLDPGGTTHYYKEFEVNARGATWDLCLNKPYGNGGFENSGRTMGKNGWELGEKAAVHIDGKLDGPEASNKGWFVEVALPIKSLLVNQTGAEPAIGKYWRTSFSRVEWRVLRQGSSFVKDPAYPKEDNWVWQPMAEINMHLPERWGILQFADEHVGATPVVRDPSWPVRRAAALAYDAQGAHHKETGQYSTTLEELPASGAVASCVKMPPTVKLEPDAQSWTVRAESLDGRVAATVRDDRYLTVEQM